MTVVSHHGVIPSPRTRRMHTVGGVYEGYIDIPQHPVFRFPNPTDHLPLIYLRSSPPHNSRGGFRARWAHFFSGGPKPVPTSQIPRWRHRLTSVFISRTCIRRVSRFRSQGRPKTGFNVTSPTLKTGFNVTFPR